MRVAGFEVTNVSNPAALGAQWEVPDPVTRGAVTTFQLSAGRGSRVLMFGIKRAGRGWLNMPVSSPERFGMTRAPQSWKEFARIVEAYMTAD
jgi:hypothetical protein